MLSIAIYVFKYSCGGSKVDNGSISEQYNIS
jgi:hypothetical protein